jgi:hypothetical protein
LRGELLARSPGVQARGAPAAFRAAIKLARQQGAAILERRASDSLRHWRGVAE